MTWMLLFIGFGGYPAAFENCSRLSLGIMCAQKTTTWKLLPRTAPDCVRQCWSCYTEQEMINEGRARPDKKKVRKSQRVPHRREKFDAASARTIFVTLRLPASSALRKSEPSTRVLCQRFHEKLEQVLTERRKARPLHRHHQLLGSRVGCR